MNYRDLEIWQLARDIVNEIHYMTLRKLPKFEMYEEGMQIRRSSKSVKATIVEGYGRRSYKQDYLKFLIYAISSYDETLDHLETLYETKSLTDDSVYIEIREKLDKLGRKLNKFIQAVEQDHKSKK